MGNVAHHGVRRGQLLDGSVQESRSPFCLHRPLLSAAEEIPKSPHFGFGDLKETRPGG